MQQCDVEGEELERLGDTRVLVETVVLKAKETGGLKLRTLVLATKLKIR